MVGSASRELPMEGGGAVGGAGEAGAFEPRARRQNRRIVSVTLSAIRCARMQSQG